MPSRVALVIILLCAAAGGRALAHHSFAAEFDASKAIRVTGTLAKVEWTNPHTYFYLDVKDESGAVVRWACESGAPGALSRRGFKRSPAEAGRHAGRGRLPGEERRQPDGRAPRDAARRSDRFGRVGRRRRPAVSAPSRLAAAVVAVRRARRASRAHRAGAPDAPGRHQVPKGRPAPRMANGKPDLSGYWKGTTQTRPGGNIGKDLPGWKLPLTPAGEAALKHNLTATVDPEAVCIIGGIPRHNASGLPFEVLQGSNKIAFMYWYSYFRLIPFTPGLKHSDDPDPVVLRRRDRPLGRRHARHRLDRLQGREGVDRRERQPAQRRAARRRALDAARLRPHPRRDADRGSEVLHAPFTYARTWVLGEPDEQIQEYSCSENNVDAAHLGFGPGPIRARRHARLRRPGAAAAAGAQENRWLRRGGSSTRPDTSVRRRARRRRGDLHQRAPLGFVILRADRARDREAALGQQVRRTARARGVVRHRHDGPILRDPRQALLELGGLDAQIGGESADRVSSSGRRTSSTSSSAGFARSASKSARVSFLALNAGAAPAARPVSAR